MRSLIALTFATFSFFACTELTQAQTQPAVAVTTAQALAAVPATPAAKAALVTAPAGQVVDPIMVPPAWMQDVIISVKALPVVGPFVIKAMEWLGVIASILTALCAFLMAMASALNGLANIAALQSLASKVQAFENSKVFYYLKYVSMFNAPTPAPVAQQAPVPPADKAA